MAKTTTPTPKSKSIRITWDLAGTIADFDGDTTALEALRAASRTLAKAIEEFNAWYAARCELHGSIVEKLAGRSTTAIAKEIPEFARFMPVAPTGGDLALVGPCELVQRLIAAGFKAQP